MKSKTEKTSEIRAKELYAMIYGKDFLTGDTIITLRDIQHWRGWLKLGKFVLDLERKWTKAKKGRRVRGD